jgi:hypothetical protein
MSQLHSSQNSLLLRQLCVVLRQLCVGKVVFIILALVAQQQLQTCKGLLQGFADKRALLQTSL